MAEFAVHFAMLIILVLIIARLWSCLKLGRMSFNADWATTDDKMHLIDHLLGILLFMAGALFSVAALFVELLTHIVGDPAQLHIHINVGLCVTLIGAGYIAWHIEKEETPTHPFYHWLGRRKEPR